MYCPAHLEDPRMDVLLELIERHPLATIVSCGPSGLVADHIPLMHEPVPGTPGKLIGHVARNNPFWNALPDQEHLIVFQGPSAYISPNWYASKAATGKVVPTWNYTAVHVSATVKAIHEPALLLQLLEKLTSRHEAMQPRPWKVADAPTEFTERLLEHIVGIELNILSIHGKLKLSQNQSPEDRQGVIAGLEQTPEGIAQQMAVLMRQFDPH